MHMASAGAHSVMSNRCVSSCVNNINIVMHSVMPNRCMFSCTNAIDDCMVAHSNMICDCMDTYLNMICDCAVTTFECNTQLCGHTFHHVKLNVTHDCMFIPHGVEQGMCYWMCI